MNETYIDLLQKKIDVINENNHDEDDYMDGFLDGLLEAIKIIKEADQSI